MIFPLVPFGPSLYAHCQMIAESLKLAIPISIQNLSFPLCSSCNSTRTFSPPKTSTSA